MQADIPLLRRLHRIALPTPFAVGPVHSNLAEDLLPRMGANDAFLAVSQMVGHLELLQSQGKVGVEADPRGVWRYAVT